MSRNLVWLVIALNALNPSIAAAAANLAPEAAYTVAIHGYAYRGQVLPGTNRPVTDDGFAPAPPWQGPRQALTDGRRDGAVVTSWYWSQMDKRIVVRFDLRRAATITALRAWPQQGTPNYAAASARCAATAAGLARAAELKLLPDGDGVAWSGEPISGRFVELTVASGQPQMSLAEVAIEGTPQGAVAPDAPPPGLIVIPPRDLAPLVALPAMPAGATNLARQRGLRLTVSSSHWDDRSGAHVPDTCATDSDPTGTALCDGSHTGGVRSFSGWFSAKRVQVDLALPEPARLDRLVVWSSGHRSGRSFLNCVKVWLQAGQGAAWVPAGETWNPLLPGEVPAAEYPVVTPPLAQEATAVRLELVGIAQSADFLQVGEIELWGQATGRPLTGRAWRVKRPVPAIAPVAPAPLDTAYDWLRRERLRGLYGYVGQWQDKGLLDQAVAAGFNCLIVHTMGPTHRADGWPAEAQQWAKVQRERKLHVIVSWPYGSDERYGNTQFGAYQPGGTALWRRGPCPLSREYWDRVVGDRAVTAAEAGLTGLVVDMEMYGADSTRFPGPCYCDTCWGRFVDGHLDGVTAGEVALAARPAWVAANALSADYARWQELAVMAILQAIRERVRAVNPRFLLGNLLDAESLPGLARGFGTAAMPALVFSELEYGGNVAPVPARVERLRAQGYPVWYVPGLWIKPVTPPRLPELVRAMAPGTGGYWIWSSAAFAANPGGDYAHAAGFSHGDYWQAFRQANAALSAALR